MKPEARLQRDVTELAHRYRFLCAHFKPAQVRDGVWVTPVGADGAGFPDLVLCGEHAVCFVELKVDNGKLSGGQQRWLDALRRAGQNAFVWRPRDWFSGEIEATLRGLSQPRRCPLCGTVTVDGLCAAHGALGAADGLTEPPRGMSSGSG